MKKKILLVLPVLFFATFICLSGSNVGAFTTSTNSTEVTLNNHLDTNIKTETKKIEKDVTTNLLLDSNNKDLETIKEGNQDFKLDKIELTRYRQKLKIDYYLGDYNSSTLIGSDEGYVDYDDSISSYVKSIEKVNTDFNQSIPLGYKFVTHPSSQVPAQSYVPAYTDGSTIEVKVLIAAVRNYDLNVSKYQNRQGVIKPSPLNKTRSELQASTDFWKVNTLSTSFNAILGQKIDLKKVGQFNDTFTQGLRKGELQVYGVHDINDDKLKEVDTIIVDSTTPATTYASGTYEVDDYDQPQKNPGHGSSVTSGGTVGFVGPDPEWKSEFVKETMDLSNTANYEKIKAYPFNLDDDPFDTPEHPLNYVPDNWFLGHRITLDYFYKTQPIQNQYYKVNFESNGGSKVESIDNVLSGSLINKPQNPTKEKYIFDGWYGDVALKNKWNFTVDKVLADTTLYAKWITDEGTDTITNKPDKIAKAGKYIGAVSLIVAALGTTTYLLKRRV